MEKNILFKNTIYLLITRVVKFIVGFIRTKLIAIYLGTYGTGIISQLNQLTELMARFTVSGMSDGLVKEIAESDKNENIFKENIAVFIKTYCAVISIFLICVITIALLLKQQLTLYYFGDNQYSKYFIIGLITFPLLVIDGIAFAVLRSFKQIKYIARSELLGIIINLFIFIPLIYLWGLFGAGIYITLAYITILVLDQYFAYTIVLKNIKVTLRDIIKAKINSKVIKELFIFAGFGMTAGISLIFTEIITRSIVVTKMGIREIGLYSPVLIWTSLFIGLIMPSISTYLYPRYCECKSNDELIIVMNDSLRFVTILMIPFILISIPLRYQIIPIVYSAQFRAAGAYLPWHLFGTLFYMWMYIFDQAMKPTGRIKTGGIIIILMSFMDISVVYLLVPKVGLYGFMLKYLVSPVIIFIFYITYWKYSIKYKLEIKNIVLMGFIITAFALLMIFEKYITTDYKVNFALGISLSAISFILLNTKEKEMIIRTIKNTVKKTVKNNIQSKRNDPVKSKEKIYIAR